MRLRIGRPWLWEQYLSSCAIGTLRLSSEECIGQRIVQLLCGLVRIGGAIES
jgi:hypothetical protein